MKVIERLKETHMLEQDIERVVVSREEIKAACEKLGKQLTEDLSLIHI